MEQGFGPPQRPQPPDWGVEGLGDSVETAKRLILRVVLGLLQVGHLTLVSVVMERVSWSKVWWQESQVYS
jgi:hypothetical protein